jgi:hypothetical protein
MAIRNHSKTLTFNVALLGGHNIVLRFPWLQEHDPLLHWSSGKVMFMLDYCEKHCLALPASMFLNQCPLICTLETVDDHPEPELGPPYLKEVDLFTVKILECLESLKEDILEHYWDSLDMFNGEKATSTLPEL